MKQLETVKTARTTILTTPQFKAFLKREAEREGLSVSQLVRQRCERPAAQATDAADKDEEVLAALLAQVREATQKAEASLERGLAEAEVVLAEMRERR